MDRIDKIIAENREAIEGIRTSLATNYDTPAQAIINRGMAAMNVQRFTARDDV